MADPKDETKQKGGQAQVRAPEGDRELTELETERVAGGRLAFTAERVDLSNVPVTLRRCGLAGGPGDPGPAEAAPCKCMGMSQDPKTMLPG
jgi:hypothetical protein